MLRLLTGTQFRRQETKGAELETAFGCPAVDCRHIHFPCEHQWFFNISFPHAGYFLINPVSLSLSPDAVCPPEIHTTPDGRRVELAVLALFIQKV
jgi:hypothetical protein